MLTVPIPPLRCALVVLLIVMASHAVSRPAYAAPVAVSHKIGKGIKLSADNGAWLSLRPRVMMLFSREMPENSGAKQLMSVRRARLIVKSGYTPLHLSSKLELAFSARDLRIKDGNPRQTPVLTFAVTWDRFRDLRIKVGQFKLGYSRQRLTSSGNLQMVDRSAVQAEFTLDRDMGIELFSNDLGGFDALRYVVGIYNGYGRDVFQLNGTQPMMLGRLEWLPMGGFDAYQEADLKRHHTAKVALAVAAAWLPEAVRDRGVLGNVPKDGGTSDLLTMTADLHAKWRGWSLVLEAHRRTGTRNLDAKNTEAVRAGWGMFTTVGWMLPTHRDFELTARTGGIFATSVSSLKELRESALGLSWYLSGHANKIQLDVTRLTNDLAVDWRARVQLQVSL